MDPTPSTSAPRTWRLRVELDDHPGALARVATRLADRDCNILGLSVFPVPGGVVDELVVCLPPKVGPATLVTEIRAEGGRIVGITPADVHSLVDNTTTALRAAARALRDPAASAESVRELLGADSVSGELATTAEAVLELGDNTTLVARRGWAPFTESELARVAAFGQVLGAGAVAADAPMAVITSDGAGVVLRRGTPEDADAVSSLHARCSAQTLYARYHAGVRTLPHRLLYRLLSPPRGTTLVALCGSQVVGIAQLIRTTNPQEIEISLLIEDQWQGRGLGAAVMRRLATLARAAGHHEMVAWCLPTELAFARAAAGSGLPIAIRREDNLVRIALRVAPELNRVDADGEALIEGSEA